MSVKVMNPLEEATKDSEYRKTRMMVGDGYDVYHWPEFIAFAQRLGIPLDLATKVTTIRIAVYEQPLVTMEFVPSEPK